MSQIGKRLIVSFHDLHPGSWECCRQFVAGCRACGVKRLSLLLVPRYHGDAPFTQNAAFVAWLRAMAADGHDLCLHGLYHKADQVSGGIGAQLMGRVYTAGEGEFYQMSATAAQAAATEALALCRAADLPIYGFTAPAWLMSDEAAHALAKAGFLYSARRDRIDLLQSGQSLRAPTLVYSSRSAWRRLVSRHWVSMSMRTVWREPLLRLAAHPIDFEHAGMRKHLYSVLEALSKDRVSTTYRDLIPAAARRALTTTDA